MDCTLNPRPPPHTACPRAGGFNSAAGPIFETFSGRRPFDIPMLTRERRCQGTHPDVVCFCKALLTRCPARRSRAWTTPYPETPDTCSYTAVTCIVHAFRGTKPVGSCPARARLTVRWGLQGVLDEVSRTEIPSLDDDAAAKGRVESLMPMDPTRNVWVRFPNPEP